MRFGIVGTNFVVRGFMAAVSKNDDVEVAAVCSGHYENAVNFAKEYGIPKVYSAYTEIAEDKDIDAVYIATPNALHFEQAKFFLERHIPVFLEKPMCSNAREAKELVQIAIENDTYLHHGIMPLYMPNLSVLKEKINTVGKIHNALFIFSKYSSRYDAYLQGQNPTTFRRELSNGSIMDLGVYPLSLIVTLFGKPQTISANCVKLETGVDASFQAILSYSDFSVVVMASKASDTKLHCEISGEKGSIQVPHPSLLDDVIIQMRGESEEHHQKGGNPFEFQLQNFLKEWQSGSKPKLVPYEVSIELMEVLDEIRKCCGVNYPADE